MSEHPKIAVTRRICKKLGLRYQIKNDALYLYKPVVGRYVQVCFNILNFATEDEILRMVLSEKCCRL